MSGREWTKEQDAALTEMVKNKTAVSKISAFLNRSKLSILYRIYTLGLTYEGPKPENCEFDVVTKAKIDKYGKKYPIKSISNMLDVSEDSILFYLISKPKFFIKMDFASVERSLAELMVSGIDVQDNSHVIVSYDERFLTQQEADSFRRLASGRAAEAIKTQIREERNSLTSLRQLMSEHSLRFPNSSVESFGLQYSKLLQRLTQLDKKLNEK